MTDETYPGLTQPGCEEGEWCEVVTVLDGFRVIVPVRDGERDGFGTTYGT